jgi:hypothetical protein
MPLCWESPALETDHMGGCGALQCVQCRGYGLNKCKGESCMSWCAMCALLVVYCPDVVSYIMACTAPDAVQQLTYFMHFIGCMPA